VTHTALLNTEETNKYQSGTTYISCRNIKTATRFGLKPA